MGGLAKSSDQPAHQSGAGDTDTPAVPKKRNHEEASQQRREHQGGPVDIAAKENRRIREHATQQGQKFRLALVYPFTGIFRIWPGIMPLRRRTPRNEFSSSVQTRQPQRVIGIQRRHHRHAGGDISFWIVLPGGKLTQARVARVSSAQDNHDKTKPQTEAACRSALSARKKINLEKILDLHTRRSEDSRAQP